VEGGGGGRAWKKEEEGTYWCRWLERRKNTESRFSPAVLRIKPRDQKLGKNIRVHDSACVLGLVFLLSWLCFY
jgi:uncharacterized protein YodC (DUF2158 family)